MRSRKAIERYMQLSFLAWAVLLIAKVTGRDFKTVVEEMRRGDVLDEIKLVYFVEMLVSLHQIFDSAGSKEELAKKLADLLWE